MLCLKLQQYAELTVRNRKKSGAPLQPADIALWQNVGFRDLLLHQVRLHPDIFMSQHFHLANTILSTAGTPTTHIRTPPCGTCPYSICPV